MNHVLEHMNWKNIFHNLPGRKTNLTQRLLANIDPVSIQKSVRRLFQLNKCWTNEQILKKCWTNVYCAFLSDCLCYQILTAMSLWTKMGSNIWRTSNYEIFYSVLTLFPRLNCLIINWTMFILDWLRLGDGVHRHWPFWNTSMFNFLMRWPT